MNNWYEASIRSLVEEAFRDNGYYVDFDPTESWNTNMEPILMQQTIDLYAIIGTILYLMKLKNL